MVSENTTNFVLQIIDPILNGSASEVEVKADAVRRYVTDIQEVSKSRVFTSGCNNVRRDLCAGFYFSLFTSVGYGA